MSTLLSQNRRIVSGMRPTGKLHLGHYHGVLKNWAVLQHQYDCYFFVADWHALTTHYATPKIIQDSIWEMVIDWLAAGINPRSAHLFVQSWVPEHAELQLLLSMMTPKSWLERVPTYRDQQAKLTEHDLSTYGFLGYPLLMSADVLIYHADYVPVGEDQIPHVELAREVARRFNYLYGQEPDFMALAEEAINKLGKKNAKLYRALRKQYQEQGSAEALAKAQALLDNQANIAIGDQERLLGYLEGNGKIILTEPEVLLTEDAKLPGLDGQKMSKSYHNTITLREEPASVEKKIRTMPTDPARVRRGDPGEPEKCPVWQLHKVYADESLKQWVQTGCRSASIGCLQCKQPLIDQINAQLAEMREVAKEYAAEPDIVQTILAEGSEIARDEAKKNLVEIRDAMKLDY